MANVRHFRWNLPAFGALVALTWGLPAAAQELPACDDAEVFEVAAVAVTDAHQRSNFGGFGGENKIIEALGNLRALEGGEHQDMAGGIALLARQAEIPIEDIRACVTTEWAFRQRSAVFIMRSPDDPAEWGLFMYNVALDLPVAAGWLVEPDSAQAERARIDAERKQAALDRAARQRAQMER